jgi:sec-independent protein translocase protein TatC
MAAEPLGGTVIDDREGGTMTLLEHLLELRMRVMWSGIAVVAGLLPFLAPPIGKGAVEFLLDPAVSQNPSFRAQAISPMENIVVYFRVALLGGIAVAMPVLLYHIMRFVTPALTDSERKWILPVVVGASVSFLAGISFAYWVVLPVSYGFLFSFGAEFADPTPTISSYMDLTTRLIGAIGLSFQMPILVMGLAKFGVLTARRLWGFKRWAILLVFVAAAILTPTPDPVTQALVAGPMVVLYFISIGLAWLVRR